MDYPLKMATQLRPQLQALRQRRKMTQAQLGEAIGVTQARIVEIEANPGLVSLQQIMQVLSALGSSLVIREIVERNSQDGDVVLPVAAKKSNSAGKPRRGSW